MENYKSTAKTRGIATDHADMPRVETGVGFALHSSVDFPAASDDVIGRGLLAALTSDSEHKALFLLRVVS